MPKVMKGFRSFSSALPQVLAPACSPGLSPSLGDSSGSEIRPAPGLTCCCPMGFQCGSCQMLRQFYFPPGCRSLRATVRPQALPFLSEPGFLFAHFVGSKQIKSLCQLLGSFVSPDSLGGGLPLRTVAGKPDYPKPWETEVLTLTKPHLICIVGE